MSEWKSINTAPKNGEWVLIRGGGVDDQWYGTESVPPAVVAKFVDDIWGGSWYFADWDGDLRSSYENPSEWMEIPA